MQRRRSRPREVNEREAIETTAIRVREHAAKGGNDITHEQARRYVQGLAEQQHAKKRR